MVQVNCNKNSTQYTPIFFSHLRSLIRVRHIAAGTLMRTKGYNLKAITGTNALMSRWQNHTYNEIWVYY
jgi:hypothetical protein